MGKISYCPQVRIWMVLASFTPRTSLQQPLRHPILGLILDVEDGPLGIKVKFEELLGLWIGVS